MHLNIDQKKKERTNLRQYFHKYHFLTNVLHEHIIDTTEEEFKWKFLFIDKDWKLHWFFQIR
jgi:hypothetical protein